MKESTRRMVLFAIIVTTGSVMILFDVPLIVMLPLIVLVGFVILLVLGAITLADIKGAFGRIRPKPKAAAPAQKAPAAAAAPGKKAGILDRLKGIRISFKKGAEQKPAAKPAATAEPAKGGGIAGRFAGIAASISSLGAAFRHRSKAPRKVGDINQQLDKAVAGKVEKQAVSAQADGIQLPAAAAGGAGAAPAAGAEADPFLSLSDDEFDPGLLEGLDDKDFSPPVPGPDDAAMPAPGPAPEGVEPDLPAPSLDIDAASSEILKSQGAEGLDEFSGLDGGESLDSDFGDLESVNLDDVDMEGMDDLSGDAGMPEAPGEAEAAPAPIPEPAAAAAPAGEAPGAVKTAWIPSDAPKEQMEDQISTQSDMASFASGSGGSDEDLLSSIASDVKTVKKEKDVSLLRELKDFKAPANEIEKELSDLYGRIADVRKTQTEKADTKPANGMK